MQTSAAPSQAASPIHLQDADLCRAIESRFKRELRRHHISERPRLVAEAIADASFGLGLPSVNLPKLETISDLTGIPKAHVHGAIQALHDMRILSVRQKEGTFQYTLNPNSDVWKVQPRIALAVTLRTMALIRELNGIPQDSAAAPLENSASHPANQIAFPFSDSVTVTAEHLPEIA